MSLRLGALHDALLDPGNEAKARAAAEEVADYQSRMRRITGRLSLLTVVQLILAVALFALSLYQWMLTL